MFLSGKIGFKTFFDNISQKTVLKNFYIFLRCFKLPQFAYSLDILLPSVQVNPTSWQLPIVTVEKLCSLILDNQHLFLGVQNKPANTDLMCQRWRQRWVLSLFQPIVHHESVVVGYVKLESSFEGAGRNRRLKKSSTRVPGNVKKTPEINDAAK